MAGKRLSVQKRQEIIRYKEMGLKDRQIARALKCSRNTVKKALENGSVALPPSIPHPPKWVESVDWRYLHASILKGVPLNVLWEELSAQGKITVQYPGLWKQYCKRYPKSPLATMVKIHLPGDKVEIDYCDGVDIYNPVTGEVIKTHFFVGVLCYSRYCYAEFSLSQKSQDFLSSHIRMFEYFGGVPYSSTPDNLKSAVIKAHRYDPETNPAYTRFAEHYNLAILPARVRTPKDKAIVERTIQIFQRWFFYRIRNITFTSLVELNQHLKEALKIFHQKKHRILQKTRSEMFEEEKPYLKELPLKIYEVKSHGRATVHDDCHLQFEGAYYSADWKFIGKKLDIWFSDKVVEIWHEGEIVAIHNRIYSRGKFQTNKKHYPPNHQAYLEITPASLIEKATEVGENTFSLISELLNNEYPLRHFRKAQGILSLLKKYSPQQLDQACERALFFKRYKIQFIEKLIKNGEMDIIKTKVSRNTNPYLRGYYFIQ